MATHSLPDTKAHSDTFMYECTCEHGYRHTFTHTDTHKYTRTHTRTQIIPPDTHCQKHTSGHHEQTLPRHRHVHTGTHSHTHHGQHSCREETPPQPPISQPCSMFSLLLSCLEQPPSPSSCFQSHLIPIQTPPQQKPSSEGHRPTH